LHEIYISTAQHLKETPCKNLAKNNTGILLKMFKTESLLLHVFFSLFFFLWHLGSWQSLFKALL